MSFENKTQFSPHPEGAEQRHVRSREEVLAMEAAAEREAMRQRLVNRLGGISLESDGISNPAADHKRLDRLGSNE